MRTSLLIVACLLPVIASADESPASQPASQPSFHIPNVQLIPEELCLPPLSDGLGYTPRPRAGAAVALSFGVTAGLLAAGLASLELSEGNNFYNIPTLVLLGGAMSVGPSVGHLYAGDKVRAKQMIRTRAALFATSVSGLFIISGIVGDTELPIHPVVGVPLLVAGGSSLLVLMGYDLIDSGFVARRVVRRGSLSALGGGLF